jgi:carboxymethylenebutenolidase
VDNLVPIPSPGVPVYYGELGAPFVVIIHDWYGRLPSLEPFARSIVARGYCVAIPDLYAGVATIDPETAQALMDKLDVGISLAIIDDVIEGARASGSSKVAEIGFSMGGWLALLHAQGGDVDAVAAYYATLGPSDHGVIPCPVLLHYAETDEWENGGYPDDFIARLDEHGTPESNFTYIGTRHSFANANIAGAIDLQAASLAFARTLIFLEKHLAT